MAQSLIFVVLLSSIFGSCFGDSLRFVGLGDWGGQSDSPYTTQVQLQVASQIAITAESFKSQFTLAIGDNFYDSGIPTDVHDSRFKNTFEKIYTDASLQSRWYLVLGNHDHKGNVTAQIAYTQLSNRWYLPSEWYSVTNTLPGTNTTVQFVFIDTYTFPGFEKLEDHDNIWNRNVERKKAQAQLEWIENQLSSSIADWVFVIGHYPVYSIASHGPTRNLIELLKPLMLKYNVAAYFSGHDHDLQHIRVDGTNLDYYLTGAGHAIDLSQDHLYDIPSGSLKFNWPTDSDAHGGFITVEITDKQNMQVNYIDDSGTVLYTHQKTNPRF